MQVTRPALRPCATCSTESPTMILKLQIMAALVLDHVPLQADDKYKDQYCELQSATSYSGNWLLTATFRDCKADRNGWMEAIISL